MGLLAGPPLGVTGYLQFTEVYEVPPTTMSGTSFLVWVADVGGLRR